MDVGGNRLGKAAKWSETSSLKMPQNARHTLRQSRAALGPMTVAALIPKHAGRAKNITTFRRPEMAEFFSGRNNLHVELYDLLKKLEGWSESSAQGKIAIADGLVKVDGAVETRKRCKIVAGQTVSFEGQSVTVTA